MTPIYQQNETVLVIGGHPVAPTEDYAIRFVRGVDGPVRAVLFHAGQPVAAPHRFMAVGRTRADAAAGE